MIEPIIVCIVVYFYSIAIIRLSLLSIRATIFRVFSLEF